MLEPFGTVQPAYKSHEDIDYIFRVFFKGLTFRNPISEFVSKAARCCYSEYGKGILTFDITQFGCNLLDPSKKYEKFETGEIFNKKMSYLTTAAIPNMIELFSCQNFLEKYNSDSQYILGLSFKQAANSKCDLKGCKIHTSCGLFDLYLPSKQDKLFQSFTPYIPFNEYDLN